MNTEWNLQFLGLSAKKRRESSWKKQKKSLVWASKKDCETKKQQIATKTTSTPLLSENIHFFFFNFVAANVLNKRLTGTTKLCFVWTNFGSFWFQHLTRQVERKITIFQPKKFRTRAFKHQWFPILKTKQTLVSSWKIVT